MEKKTFLSTIAKKRYELALVRLLAEQNRDGSWGSGFSEKVTLTAQMIQLLLALNVKNSDAVFVSASRWLEDNVNKGDDHWATRLEIGLKIGDYHKLLNNGLITSFIEDLNHDLDYPEEAPYLDFFWHIIPTLIALNPYERDLEERGIFVPHGKVIARIEHEHCHEFPDGCVTIEHHPNNTGLVALYYMAISQNEKYKHCRRRVDSMANWLLQTRRERRDVGVCWDESKSVTSYVAMDLLECISAEMLEQYLPNIIKYLSLSEQGFVSGDKKTTYDSDIHKKSIYSTILVLRALAEIIKKLGTGELADAYKNALAQKSMQRHYRFKKRVSKIRVIIPTIICSLLIATSIICYVFEKNEVGSLLLSTGFAGILGLFFDWLKKPGRN